MSNIVYLNDLRTARGLAPISPAEAFGPPRGKRIGDAVILADGRRGLVTGWRPHPGHSATLFITAGTMSLARAADDVAIDGMAALTDA